MNATRYLGYTSSGPGSEQCSQRVAGFTALVPGGGVWAGGRLSLEHKVSPDLTLAPVQVSSNYQHYITGSTVQQYTVQQHSYQYWVGKMATMLIQLTPDLLTNKLTCLMSSETTTIPEHPWTIISRNTVCYVNTQPHRGSCFSHLWPCLTTCDTPAMLSAVPGSGHIHLLTLLLSYGAIRHEKCCLGSGQIPIPPVKLIPLQISSLMGHSTDDC